MGALFGSMPDDSPPAAPPEADPDAEEAKARKESLERRRRGRLGFIQTSARGVLQPGVNAPQRRTLLGE